MGWRELMALLTCGETCAHRLRRSCRRYAGWEALVFGKMPCSVGRLHGR